MTIQRTAPKLYKHIANNSGEVMKLLHAAFSTSFGVRARSNSSENDSNSGISWYSHCSRGIFGIDHVLSIACDY